MGLGQPVSCLPVTICCIWVYEISVQAGIWYRQPDLLHTHSTCYGAALSVPPYMATSNQNGNIATIAKPVTIQVKLMLIIL